MLAVSDDAATIEVELGAGRLRCPDCDASLSPWGWAQRRQVRFMDGPRTLRPRRTNCPGCGRTHVLIPTCLLLRRSSAAEIIGMVLQQAAGGRGHRPIASDLQLAPDTVRNWLRRFRQRGPAIRGEATRLAYELNLDLVRIEPQSTALADTLHGLGIAAAAAVRRLGRIACFWEVVSALTQTRLLSPG